MLTIGRVFGAVAPTSAAEHVEALTVQKAELELVAAQEALKTAKSDRIWTAVGGLVAVASLIVSVVALRRGAA